MTYIRSHHKQAWLLAPNIEEMIPADHICYLVEALIEMIDFTRFDKKYADPGHPAYHPRIILKLLVMGVLDRVRSSRKLARNAMELRQRVLRRGQPGLPQGEEHRRVRRNGKAGS